MSKRAGSGRAVLTERPEPLVERAAELATLTAALDRAQDGAGSAVLIEGAPGLGKTRLLAEIVIQAADRMSVLHACGAQSEQDFTFGLALRLFEPHLRRQPPDQRHALLEGAAGLASSLFAGGGPDSGRSRFSMVHGLFWLAANIAERSPLLVCVDDLQWADEASRCLVHYLARRVGELPIALALAARPRPRCGEDEALAAMRDPSVIELVRLSPLNRPATAGLARAMAPGVRAGDAAVCVDLSEGNPLRLRELLTEQLADSSAGSREESRLAAGGLAERVALHRLARLGPDAVRLAEALAVLGGQTPLHRAAGLANVQLDVAAAQADRLAEENLIVSGALLDFVHPLIRRGVYSSIAPARRALAHAEAARLLHDAEAPCEEVAEQLKLAPAGGATWVIDVLRAAALRAGAHGRPTTAARYLDRALAEDCDPPTRECLELALGEAESAAGIAGSVERFRAILERPGVPERNIAVRRMLARAHARAGNPAQAAEVLEDALTDLLRLGTRASELRAAVVDDYISHTEFQPRLRRRSLTLVTALLRDVQNTGTAAELALRASLALCSGQSWQPNSETIELAARAWSDGALLEDEGPDGSGWLRVVWALELAEDSAGARIVSAAAVDAARSAGSTAAFAAASYFHGFANLRLGQLVRAQADADQAIEAGHDEAHRYQVPALVLRANALVARADLAAAGASLALAQSLGGDAILDFASKAHAAGRLALARQRPAEALGNFLQAGSFLSEQLEAEHSTLPWRADAARAALLLGARDRALDLLDAEQSAAERKGSTIALGRALSVRGCVIARPGQTDGLCLLERAVAILEPSAAELEHAHALAALGAARWRAGMLRQSREPLARAHEISVRLGAELLARSVRTELAAAGWRPRTTAPRLAGQLTPSEQRVAALAAQGMTNNEIAQALFVTPKTIEFHLRNTYQRLGVTGRRHLAAALAEHQFAAALGRVDAC
ncbi:MAG: helix-turn-helix transcriptional regulator [Jatrophihabitantaceae bacterium]